MEFDPVAYINEPRWQESRLGLEREIELLDRMGRPQDRLAFVHVAGTNGKGSTCAYIESALRCAGFNTGLFTSPYIMEFEERIRVNGENITPEELRDVTLFVREHAEAMARETGEHPTEFELMTAIAFEHFARRGCEIVVCEVGLGGRLDSTNVIDAPEVSVICRIGLDHTDMLGDTPAAIAHEKAGIVKAGRPVVSWPQDDAGAMRAIEDAAHGAGSQLVVCDFDELQVDEQVSGGVRGFAYRGWRYETGLLATYQPYNAAVALDAIGLLREHGWNVPREAEAAGIAKATWPGRFEVVGWDPPIVVDGGHNPQGAEALADSLSNVFGDERVSFVMGVLADKDYEPMIRAVVPHARSFACVTPPNPRALSAASLAEAIRAQGFTGPVEVADGFADALARARAQAGSAPVCAFGSLYSVANVKAALAG